MSNPKIQGLLGDFLEHLDKIIDSEFKMNKE